MIQIAGVSKTYGDGFVALKKTDLTVNRGEIFALLGPNGAGKTTLISIVCGLVNKSSGQITIDGLDHQKDYRKVRQQIGLVPQELTTSAFETVWQTVNFSRGLFGLAPNPKFIDQVLSDLSLSDKKNNKLVTLSGGMKRRVMIAKALAHEPKVLFLDEPTAGVDVELRKDMWAKVHALRQKGVTIILTTHYIEEAEQMADRIGIINKGEIILTEAKSTLMQKMGQKCLIIDLLEPLVRLPESLLSFGLQLSSDKQKLIYSYDQKKGQTAAQDKIAPLLEALGALGIAIKDLNTKTSSLEDIFVHLLNEDSA